MYGCFPCCSSNSECAQDSAAQSIAQSSPGSIMYGLVCSHRSRSGMLPGYVAGWYSYEECHIDLAVLAEFAGARLIIASATGVDSQACRDAACQALVTLALCSLCSGHHMFHRQVSSFAVRRCRAAAKNVFVSFFEGFVPASMHSRTAAGSRAEPCGGANACRPSG